MKKVTYEQFLELDAWWLPPKEAREQLQNKAWWGDGKTALDILNFDEMDVEYRIYTVLRPEFIEDPILYEFACRCGERALAALENPNPSIVAGIEKKRAWLRREISDDELEEVWRESMNVTWDATNGKTFRALQTATFAMSFKSGRDAALDASIYEAMTGKPNEERQWQVEELKKMILGGDENG